MTQHKREVLLRFALNTKTTLFVIQMSGYDYNSDEYKEWTQNFQFTTMREAVRFQREVTRYFEGKEYFSPDDYELNEFLEDQFNHCIDATFFNIPLVINVVDVKVTPLSDAEIRKYYANEIADLVD